MLENRLQFQAGKLFSVIQCQWFRHIQSLTTRTQSHYRMVLNYFSTFAPVYINDLTLEHIELYIDTLIGKGRTNRTANAHLTALKSFGRYLEDHDLPNPCRKIQLLTEDPPSVRILEPAEYLKILSVCNESESNVLKFLANTGLRATEFIELKWCNVSLDYKYITFSGKGRKHRVIPLNSIAQAILHKYTRQNLSTHINLLKSITTNTRRTLYRMCARLSKKAKIVCANPHSFRHYFATSLYNAGVPISKISVLLGHSSVRTTERIYIHWLPRDLDGITEVLVK